MANSLQHNWESVFFDTYNKIIEDNGELTVSDIRDDSDNVVGKFYLSYSDDNHPYIISIQDNTLCILDVYKWYTVVSVCKSDNVYKFPVNHINIPRTLLIKVFRKVSELITTL